MKNSTKIFSTSAIIIVIVIAISFITIKNKNKIEIAKVNGVVIYQSEIQSRIDAIFTIENFGGNEVKSPKVETLPSEIIELLAKEIYLEKELLIRAKKSKITNSQEVKDKIENATNQIIRQAYIDNAIKKELTEEALLEKYAKLSQELEGKKEYLIYHIVTKEESEAGKAMNILKIGGYKNFEAVAKKYSIDQSSAEKGGELGYVLEDNMIKEIANVIKNLKVGDVSAPVQTKFGWHIIKLAEIRDAKALAFDEVKDSLKNQLTQDIIAKLNSDIAKEVKIELLTKVKDKNSKKADEAKEDSKEESLEAKKEVEAETEAETEVENIEDEQENKDE